MRIALISDTHGQLPLEFPDGIDAIVHAGDVGPDHAPLWWMGQFRDHAPRRRKGDHLLTFVD